MKPIFGIGVACILAATATHSQSVNLDNKTFTIPKVDRAPQLDGRLSADEWSQAILIEDLHEVRPNEFSAPTKRTQFYFMYTEDALFVAARVYDNPEEMTANVMRHGQRMQNEDRIHLLIDPYNNKRSGYQFQTNPNGVRHEAIYTGASDLSFDWSTIWDVAATTLEDGWITEIEVPFKSLTFDPNNNTWGVNFWRSQLHDQTTTGWYSRNGVTNVANAGTMTGISGVNQGVGLDIVPSFSSTYRDDRILGRESELVPSLDLTYKLTPSLNLSVTLNTDFAATEVDDIQLDVGRFSQRFPEKRSFFLADTDIFNFASDNNADPFHSRTIGLTGGQPVDLIAGAKLSGRIGDYDVGALIIRQDEFGAIDATDVFVGRVARGVLAESQIGVIYTYGDPRTNNTSSTIGADFVYRNTRLPNNRDLEATFWVQKTDNPGINSDDMAWSASVDLPSNDSWFVGATLQEVQDNYNPRLGFRNRPGVRQYAVEGGKNWNFRDHPWIQKIVSTVDIAQYDSLSGGLQSREMEWEVFELTTRVGDTFGVEINHEEQVLLPGERAPLEGLGPVIPPGTYKFTQFGGNVQTTYARPWNVNVRGAAGDYYTGTTWNLRPGVEFRPNRELSFDLSYELAHYDMPDGNVVTRVAQLRNEIAFNTSLSLVNLIQYDNVSDALGFNSRLRWNMQAGRDLWFVVSHGLMDDDEDGNFTRIETSATLKVAYTLRY